MVRRMVKITIKTTEKSPSKTRYDFRYGNFDLFNICRPYHTVRYPVQYGHAWGDIYVPTPVVPYQRMCRGWYAVRIGSKLSASLALDN